MRRLRGKKLVAALNFKRLSKILLHEHLEDIAPKIGVMQRTLLPGYITLKAEINRDV